MKFDEAWKLTLAPAQARLFIVQPIQQGFAPIGIVDKLISPKTIKGWKREGNRVKVSLLQGGNFAAYCEALPVSVKAGNQNLNFEYQNAWLTARVTEGFKSDAGGGTKRKTASATELSVARSNGRRRVSVS